MEGRFGTVAPAQELRSLDASEPDAPPAGRRLVAIVAREPFVALALALDALLLSARPWNFVESDTWLALVSGRLVWRHWLPHHDTLTIWPHGATWVDQQWLGQLLFYGIDSVGGLRLLLLVHVALLVTAFGLSLIFARRAGASSRSVALVGVVGVLVALPNSAARAQSFAFVLFVALFWLLASSAGTGSRRVLLTLPLLALWANIHGSAVFGAGLVVLWALAEIVALGRRTERGAWVTRVRSTAIAVVAPLCLLVSPYGLDLVHYYRGVFGAGAFRDLVTEWRPATFPGQLPFFALALAAVWLTARKPGRLRLFEHLALLAALVGGLDGIRNIVWFALVAVMVVPRAVDGVWPAGDAPVRRRANLALALAAVLLIVISFSVAASHPSSSYARGFPHGAAAAVSAAAASDPSARVFANEAFADWLLWEAPALAGRVAFDARFELLTSEQLHAIAHFRERSSAHWLAAAAGYRVLVLDSRTEKQQVQTVLAEQGARPLYRDRHVTVILR